MLVSPLLVQLPDRVSRGADAISRTRKARPDELQQIAADIADLEAWVSETPQLRPLSAYARHVKITVEHLIAVFDVTVANARSASRIRCPTSRAPAAGAPGHSDRRDLSMQRAVRPDHRACNVGQCCSHLDSLRDRRRHGGSGSPRPSDPRGSRADLRSSQRRYLGVAVGLHLRIDLRRGHVLVPRRTASIAARPVIETESSRSPRPRSSNSAPPTHWTICCTRHGWPSKRAILSPSASAPPRCWTSATGSSNSHSSCTSASHVRQPQVRQFESTQASDVAALTRVREPEGLGCRSATGRFRYPQRLCSPRLLGPIRRHDRAVPCKMRSAGPSTKGDVD